MATQIEKDAFRVLEVLVSAPRDQDIDGHAIVRLTGLEPGSVNDAVSLLVDSDYGEWIQELGTAPFDFSGISITPRGRYEYQRITASKEEDSHMLKQEVQDITNGPVPSRAVIPVGSPYGFTDEDWEIVTERKSSIDTLIERKNMIF
jgi:hypothetical protein